MNYRPASSNQDRGEVKRFDSEQDFSDWLEKADSLAAYGGDSGVEMGMGMTRAISSIQTEDMAVAAPMASVSEKSSFDMGGGSAPDRFSGTNVQVAGIDEPDILKTDGREIYFSPGIMPILYRGMPTPMPLDVMPETFSIEEPYYDQQSSISVVKAFPAEELALDSEIKGDGDLLLHDNILAVLSYDGVRAQNVSDPASPQEVWQVSYENNSWLVDARLKGGELFLILSSSINYARPCPYAPLLGIEGKVEIACSAIWHPVIPVPTDVTYTVLKVDMATGKVKQTASFVGAQGSSAVYMSADNIYATYSLPADTFTFVSGFLMANADVVPSYVLEKLDQVINYDLADETKSVELRNVLGRWFQSLDQDEALSLVTEMNNRIGDYIKVHLRELQQTGIVRLDTNKLEVKSSGSIPGTLLNQFSLDEYDGFLRVATTSGETGGMFWMYGLGGGRNDSANDLYVLDMNLKVVGQALGMGPDERIYAVRFVGERGYVVTFRQTDPFYVLDLSNPRRPTVEGELKIPGYSSYLHPLKDGRILGVGQEDNRVKLSLFDVTNPTDPSELDKYSLNEYWSDVLDTHHAFLLDAEHEIFFLPGSNGGYVMSYSDDELKLSKAVSGIRARRALYLDNYLYVAGDDQIVVLDMTDWQRVNQLELR
ncbi:hypothetical protein A2480_02395 [Candidatus Uhrbacteria bacterium RIFOXYC2_FULL_47_19]|uniref:Copper amine oxidase-like N-terminal domain-containing protein n=1 Tax=Candidatus Uhrbacteria bacterium RIFOXYC2_FULL_47_19 TaxID=1802424 RepID=A0A1F7WCP7_9BACT|nr:MAG: hypothetical protein A2480_02395 [Candidatus Uhrbacteria bacterium RIFOXYC2_FULL_47_19]